MATVYLEKLRLFSRDVRLYLISTALIGLAIYGGIQPMLLNLYLVRLAYRPEFIGMVNASGALGFSILSLPAGLLGTRWSNRRMMIAGLALMVAGCGLFPVAESVSGAWQPGWLVVTNVIAWVGLALCFVNGIPFLMSATGPEERSHAFSAQLALERLAGFVGSLAGWTTARAFRSDAGSSPGGSSTLSLPIVSLRVAARARIAGTAGHA